MPNEATEIDPALVGRTIGGKFRIDALVGTGAMGAVYRARQLALNKTVAIKVMRPDCAKEKAFASRFQREAKAASRLDHPNSLQVIDFGEDQGLLYMAMEFLDGRNLLQVMRDEWPLSAERVVDLLSQVLAALAVAHEMGIVHRDLKPENIMVLRKKDDDGHAREVVKVCDFGIAKMLTVHGEDALEGTHTWTATGTLTANGMLLGTPEYMSPEQVGGEELDARSDLYSLGVILYQLLTGRLPFEGKTPLTIALKHLEKAPRPPSEVLASAEPRLEAVCMRALRKRRGERYQTARAMRSDLRILLGARDSLVHEGEVSRLDPSALASAATLLAPAPVPSGIVPKTRASAEASPAPRAWIALLVVIALVVVTALLLRAR